MNQRDSQLCQKQSALRKILNALKLCIMDRKDILFSHKAPLYQGNRLFSKSFKKPYVKKRVLMHEYSKKEEMYIYS